MTPAQAIMADLDALGIVLHADGGRLRYHPKGSMTPDLMERIKAHKEAILALLEPAIESTHPEAQPVAFNATDAEWARFQTVAEQIPGIPGWTDPGELRGAAGRALAMYLRRKTSVDI